VDTNKPIEREIGTAQIHQYSLDLIEGQYVRILVEKTSADLVLVVSRPDGERITAKHEHAIEPLGIVLISRVSGKYLIEVRALTKEGLLLSYKLSIAELRAATEADRIRATAAKVYSEGMRLLERKTEQSRY
jgi:hypothetical protein